MEVPIATDFSTCEYLATSRGLCSWPKFPSKIILFVSLLTRPPLAAAILSKLSTVVAVAAVLAFQLFFLPDYYDVLKITVVDLWLLVESPFLGDLHSVEDLFLYTIYYLNSFF